MRELESSSVDLVMPSTITPERDTEPLTAAGAPSQTAGVVNGEALRTKHARAGKAMAAATFTMAAASGLQALLYLRSYGISGRTDGFFAAFAVYASFGVFAQSIRITATPLLVGARPVIPWKRFCAVLGVIAIPVVLVTGPGSAIFAALIAPSVHAAGRDVTETALPILGAAMVLQLWAAGASTLLAISDRFGAVARAYTIGALSGLAGYLALLPLAGRQTLAWSMLVMAVVTLAAMLPTLRSVWPAAGAPATEPRPATILRSTGRILGRTVIYLAFNGLYLITLAVAARFRSGDATIVSYSYLFASYLVAGTGFSLGMARVADMTRGAESGWKDLVEATVPGGFRYVMLVSAPAVALLVVAGAPLVGAVLPASIDPHQVVLLQRCALLAIPWLIGAQLVNLLLPALFAMGRSSLIYACVVPLVAIHVGCTLLGAALFGIYGVVAALCVAPLCFAAVMFRAECRGRMRIVGASIGSDLLRFTLLAVVAFGAPYIATLPLPDAGVRSVICGLIGVTLYWLGLRVFAADQMLALHGRRAAG
jgi:peptidoglycan biosynthesis protein MviN/MurJ (putative lipid II flippase)